jgi:phosphoserine / homoserine phosphotransferase
MRKLDWPTLFCNSLIVNESDQITGYTLRQKDGKKKAVDAFRTAGCRILASGDSYNDLTMIQHADKGIFFRAPESISKEYPEYPSVMEYGDLLSAVDEFIRPA